MSGEEGETNGTPQPNALLPAPHQAERAQAGRVPEVERLEPRIDRLGPLEVQHRDRRSVIAVRGVDVRDLARDAHVPGALERQQAPGDGGRVRGGLGVSDGRRELELEHAVGSRERLAAGALGGREDREDAAAHTAGAHPRQVEVPARTTVDDAVVIRARERVVVPVERRQRRHVRGR